MKTKFVHHICIQTNNYKESIKFYQEVLGFELIQESPNFHKRSYNSWLKLGSFYIELQTGKKNEQLSENNKNSQGIVHFCLWVSNLSEEMQKIKRLGYEFLLKNNQEIYKVENGNLCKIIAPEGTIIELRDNRGI
ncbi:glyoxalase [Bacillus pseudomycoides]|uniref:Glyoxalase n=1 Tax=Bacillus pseudomycoides TaxID=64104 RepID=A0AA91VA39_9BACI|nr:MULTISPECIES: VOC family protein [Bacillus]PEB50086.1 glyoxalase [Bacillus sp. AFS098217]PED81390.1 glyoxalase [Bacillus pseudomycoides]PEU07436.1 glyoxalase [Bacillus sp. AFS014408]PEU13462.1 glyoxalase [Bacillus sp. AFS019443]PFW55810.1 glyoxalase [Bacillus sp. AFS075034]